MQNDYYYFNRRYQQIESNFLDITDFIEMEYHLNSPCYRFGSSKLMDFCLKVCTEIETIFRLMLKSNRFDSIPNIGKKRRNQNIKVYREIISPEYRLEDYKLYVKHIKREIHPFEDFDTETPEWFSLYSKNKHNKLELIKFWNLKHALFALGCLRLSTINHPDVNGRTIDMRNICDGRVFNLTNSVPRFSLIEEIPDSGRDLMIKM
jgi:hypothetical protein